MCVCVCVCVCVGGWGGGGGASGSGAGVNRVGVILLVQLKMRSCIRFCNHFRRVVYFVVLQFPSYKKETKEESIIRQISFFFFIKMMAYQTNITWC